MYPTIEIFGRTIGSYGLVSVLAALVCGALFLCMIKKAGQMMEDGIFFLMYVLVGIFLGGHLLYGITHIRYFPLLFESVGFSEWIHRFGFIFGGQVFYGGLIGGALAALLGLRIMKLDRTVFVDRMAPIIPLFHGFARIGCFLAGCCYGIPCSFGFMATGNHVVPAVNGVTRFPVQLLESLCNFILAAVLFYLLKRAEIRPRLQGTLVPIYMISYGCIRFSDEFLRGDAIRGHLWLFSTSQWISLGLITLGTILVVMRMRRTRGVMRDAKDAGRF